MDERRKKSNSLIETLPANSVSCRNGCLVDIEVGFYMDARNPVLNQHINPVYLSYSAQDLPAITAFRIDLFNTIQVLLIRCVFSIDSGLFSRTRSL